MVLGVKQMCDNKVIFHVPHKYDYRKVERKCGETDPWGNRAICDKCASDPAEMQNIQQHEENMAADNAWLKSAGWGEM